MKPNFAEMSTKEFRAYVLANQQDIQAVEILFSRWTSDSEAIILEVHKLVNGKYKLPAVNPVWLSEIGCNRGNYFDVTREWLYWYEQSGKRYPTPQEQIKLVQKRAEVAEQRAQ